ncbi:hypothetical protein KLEB273_gp085 [Bacillus phage vB_BauM_KLEB27-3]|nr:hypothetical protein KLEB273_gp085 [Bacillus phage vB_BauM_KLEB27-3]
MLEKEYNGVKVFVFESLASEDAEGIIRMSSEKENIVLKKYSDKKEKVLEDKDLKLEEMNMFNREDEYAHVLHGIQSSEKEVFAVLDGSLTAKQGVNILLDLGCTDGFITDIKTDSVKKKPVRKKKKRD